VVVVMIVSIGMGEYNAVIVQPRNGTENNKDMYVDGEMKNCECSNDWTGKVGIHQNGEDN
jgi:hypothetical protein